MLIDLADVATLVGSVGSLLSVAVIASTLLRPTPL